MFMNGYWVQYLSDTFILKSRIYELEFWKEDTLNNKTESFKLYPEIQYDNKLTKVAASNPSTKHYINCLLYTSPSPRDRTRYRMPSSA